MDTLVPSAMLGEGHPLVTCPTGSEPLVSGCRISVCPRAGGPLDRKPTLLRTGFCLSWLRMISAPGKSAVVRRLQKKDDDAKFTLAMTSYKFGIF